MIWCVEDDASIRDIEIYALKSTGFEARGFEDSASFCEAIRHEKPELIVLDIMLPGTDGIQLLRQLKASPELCDIPVVMATAKGEEYDKIQVRVILSPAADTVCSSRFITTSPTFKSCASGLGLHLLSTALMHDTNSITPKGLVR